MGKPIKKQLNIGQVDICNIQSDLRSRGSTIPPGKSMIFVIFFKAVSSVKSIRLNLKTSTFYLVFGIKKIRIKSYFLRIVIHVPIC